MEQYLNEYKNELEKGVYHVLLDLWKYTILSTRKIHQMWKGAYVEIPGDQGFFYKRWKRYGREATSSHKSCSTQYRIRGKGPLYDFKGNWVHTQDYDVLVGMKCDDQGVKTTWFQWERSSTMTMMGKWKHLVDYLKFKWMRKNLGPHGNSMYKEGRPMKLGYKKECISYNKEDGSVRVRTLPRAPSRQRRVYHR